MAVDIGIEPTSRGRQPRILTPERIDLMEARVGFEPTTYDLTDRCSMTCLSYHAIEGAASRSEKYRNLLRYHGSCGGFKGGRFEKTILRCCFYNQCRKVRPVCRRRICCTCPNWDNDGSYVIILHCRCGDGRRR